MVTPVSQILPGEQPIETSQLADLGGYHLEEPARAALLAHRWPGNLRELSNVLRYAVALCHEPDAADPGSAQVIALSHLPDALQSAAAGDAQDTPATPALSAPHAAARSESADPEALAQLLAQCQGNVSEVARLLGVNRSTVHRRIQRMLGQRQVRWGDRG